MKYFFLAALCMGFDTTTWAGEADPLEAMIIQGALKSTQEMLRSSDLRKKESEKSSAGRAAAHKLEALGGSEENNDAIYNLAADIFGDLVQETNGDPEKMKKILDEAAKNPESFAEKWNASQKSKLHQISRNISTN